MEKISYYDSTKLNNSVVILGKFDGFHLGHQRLLEIAFRLKSEYAAIYPDREPLQVVIFTFDIFPVRVLVAAGASEGRAEDTAKKIQTIQTEEERFMDPVPIEADYILEFPFNRETMSMEPEQFIDDVLVNKLGVKKIICGYDFQFGKKRRGNVGMLQALEKEKGFEVIVVPKVAMRLEGIVNEDGEPVEQEISSTWIRSEIRQGHLEEAAAMMGRPFVVTGIVQKRKTAGFYAAILEVSEHKILPPDGVYATEIVLNKDLEIPFQGGISDNSNIEIYQGMTNIRRQTDSHGGEKRMTESFLFDFQGDLEGRQSAVLFFHFMRPETEFDDRKQLTEQLQKDEAAVKEYFSHLQRFHIRETIHTPANMEMDPVEARLDLFAGDDVANRAFDLGFPLNQKSRLISFYKWFMGSGLNLTMVNNAGDPFNTDTQHMKLNMLDLEREVLEKMGPLYGFDMDDLWGILTNSGTDGNNHGIYFGSNYLKKKTHQRPVMYASDAAHYSCRRLADLQNLDLKLIPSDIHGRMIPEELEKALEPDRPALIFYALGTSFKGGSDDIDSLNRVLDRYPDLVCYRHIDAALFGGYLPYTEYRDALNRRHHPYESIAFSGHQFFGMDEPAGFFLTTMDVRNNQDANESGCLNSSMPMINSSRSALITLKLWWILQKTSIRDFEEQAAGMLENAKWLKKEFDEMGVDAWLEPMSNTVYFRRPSKAITEKYDLSQDFDDRLGGALSHIVVMQHVSKELLTDFLSEVKAEPGTK